MLAPRGGCRPLRPTRPTPRRHRRQAIAPAGFGLLPVRSPLLRESSLFLGVLRCFSSPGALFGIAPKVPGRAPGGLPHSEIPGSLAASASPGHFAAWPRPSSAANAKASTMRPSCGFLLRLPSGVCRGRDSRPARASGMVPSAAAPPRCPACAVPRWRRCVFRVCVCVCCSSVRAGDQTRAPRAPPDLGAASGSGRAIPHQGRIVPRPQNPAGSAWRIVKVQTRSRQPAGRQTHRSSRSSNLVRSRSPTSHEVSQPAGGLVTAAGMLAQRRASSAPGWSRGDSNPGPPPCKGGALPAKLRPPGPAPPLPHRTGWARLDSNQGPRPYQGRALTT